MIKQLPQPITSIKSVLTYPPHGGIFME